MNKIVDTLREADYILGLQGMRLTEVSMPTTRKKDFYDYIEGLSKFAIVDLNEEDREKAFDLKSIVLPGGTHAIKLVFDEQEERRY